MIKNKIKTQEVKMNGWKVTAIVFICLFILQTVLFGYLLKTGMQEIANEEKCANDICYNQNAESFIYESGICYCYNNGEVAYQKYMD